MTFHVTSPTLTHGVTQLSKVANKVSTSSDWIAKSTPTPITGERVGTIYGRRAAHNVSCATLTVTIWALAVLSKFWQSSDPSRWLL